MLITHGTDTLEETGYFLSLVTKSDKPVVMVGSMRPATAVSADGPANIYNGAAVAGSPEAKGRGTLISLNDEIHYARNVVKTDTTSVQTFRSLNRGPAGVVHTGTVEWFQRMDKKLGNTSEFSVDNLTTLPRVDIIYAHANMSADLIDAAIKNGAKGIVVAGVGDGNMTSSRARDAGQGGQGRGGGRPQHTAGFGHRAAEQRSERRQDGFRRVGGAHSRQGARPAAARADQDEGPAANPEDVLGVLTEHHLTAGGRKPSAAHFHQTKTARGSFT